MMNKALNFFKEKWKLLFCYLLILLGILLVIVVLIMKPMKLTSYYVYSQAEAADISEVIFPLEEKIKINHSNLSDIWIYLEDNSLNAYSFQVELRNSKDEICFEHQYVDYESNILHIYLGLIEYSKDEVFTLKINCDECQNVKVAKSTAVDNSYIVGDSDNTLRIYYDYYVPNNTFYWYSILAVVLGLMLIPFAKENSDE